MSREKDACGWSDGLSGGALFGTAGAAIMVEWDLGISTAVVGRSDVAASGRSGGLSAGRLSVDLNLLDSDLADMDSFPLFGPEGTYDGGGGTPCCLCSASSPSVGDVVSGDVMKFPDEGYRGLCPNVVADPVLGCVRCDRSETDLLTFSPISETLDVKLSRLLSLLCPLTNLVRSTCGSASSGGFSWSVAGSFGARFPVRRPKTEELLVEATEGIAGGFDCACPASSPEEQGSLACVGPVGFVSTPEFVDGGRM